jgi:hypothetical protein
MEAAVLASPPPHDLPGTIGRQDHDSANAQIG